jgi:membrane protease YdiL (CAAX protease family)
MSDEHSLPSERSVRSRIPLSLAFAWVIAAGMSAQFTGALVHGWVSRAVGPDDEATPLAASVVASTSILLLVVWMAPQLAGVARRVALGYARAPLGVYVAAAIGTVALSPLGDRLMSVMQELFPEATLGAVAALEGAVLNIPLLASLVIFALLPGVSEELLFRGILQQAAGRGVRAIAISGVVFALFHLDPHHIVGVLPLGLFLAWLTARAGTTVSIVAHITNNAFAVVTARQLAGELGYGSEQPTPWSLVAGGLLVAVACAWWLRRQTRSR